MNPPPRKSVDWKTVLGTAVLSQVLALLNVIAKPFTGTIFVFDNWESFISRTAIAVGFVVVILIVLVKRSYTKREIWIWGGISIAALLGCAGLHFLLAAGYAPSISFLFWARDVVWPILYMTALVMAGIAVAMALMFRATQ